MKIFLLLTVPLLLHLSAHAEQDASGAAKEKKAISSSPLRHVVMFKFKEGTTDEQITSIEKAFAELPSKIKTIKDYEWGTNVSQENKNQGFTHCFIVTFDDQKGLDTYGPHPAHQAFVKMLGPVLDKVLVLDFIAK